ncbi:MAG: glutathione S-transferase [Glaciecola sp.]|jgi:glutathione S-transferase
MTSSADEIILHNYPQSPVAEKARIAFGIKAVVWRDVEIPRIVPKPFLTQLTGGYRRTPVAQIGADIYCDSQCIIHELERRFPSPTFYPTKDVGLAWALSRWTDGELFSQAVQVVLGSNMEELPADFAEDRGRLYMGPNWAEELKQANANLPHLVAQIRTSFDWLNEQVSDGRKFLFGDKPAAIDAQIYHVVWFLRGRCVQGPILLSEFPALERWENNVGALGHGTSTPMSPQDAIKRAGECEPINVEGFDDSDPQGLKLGMQVEISPDVDGGEQPVTGTLVAASSKVVTIHRHDEEVGNLHIHFPRAGYKVSVI